MIIISYKIPTKEIKHYIISECIKRRLISPNDFKSKNLNYVNVYEPEWLKKLITIVKKNGGQLLSNTYFDINTELRFACSKGHEFLMKPYNVIVGSWCPECYKEKLYEKQKFIENTLKEIINKKGGIMLSNYVNKRTKIKIRCSKGHEWETLPQNIINGTWCPDCFSNKNGFLKEIQDIAKARGGTCLSNKYINNKTKLKFRCAEGHEWWARPKSIKEGTWCPECYHKQSKK